jgi:hypothetical protein
VVDDIPEYVFVAQSPGPILKQFWIYRAATTLPPYPGWACVEESWRDGDWQPDFDYWTEWFFEILRYPGDYEPLVWHLDSMDGEVIDIRALQSQLDRHRHVDGS